MKSLFRASSALARVVAVACASFATACSPPPECATIFEVRDQDRKTIDDASKLTDSSDPKQLAETGRAYHDASKKLQANAAKLDAMAPSDHTLGRFVKAYSAAVKPIVLALDGLGARLEKIGAAQATLASADDKVLATRAKLTGACKASPKLAGCAETTNTLLQVPKDEAGRKQMIRDLETVTMDPTLVPMRAELISALKDVDVARKALDQLELDPKASYVTTTLEQTGADLDKQCGKK